MAHAMVNTGLPAVQSAGNERTAGVARLRARLADLDRSQWMAFDELRAHQLRRLRVVLGHAQRTVPYYRDRFRAEGWDPRQVVTPENWRHVPLLRRRDIQTAGDALRSTRLPDDPRKIKTVVTSGSTGQPVTVLSTPLTRFQWHAFRLRDHLWRRRDFSRKLAAIRYTRAGHAMPPYGEKRPAWGRVIQALFPTGPGVMLNVDSPVTDQAAWLRQENPAYLLTYPSNVEALARHFVESAGSLPDLREVRTIGEVLPEHVRAAVKTAWGVPVTDVYTTQEVGYVAIQCPDHEHYHVQSENVWVEVIDHEGRPCRPGHVGKVILTALHNFATPLIRYDVGDYAEVAEPCSCGRGLPVLKRILGRQRNMLVLPNGDLRWPTFGQAQDMADLPPIYQFQLIQRSLEWIEVKLVVPQRPSLREEQRMRSYLRDMLGHPFDCQFTYVDHIPRSAGGKFEEFRSEIPAHASGSPE